MKYKMKFTSKPIIVDAMLFEYSVKGIEALKIFCNGSLGDVTKSRDFYSKGQAEIGYQIRDRDGDLIIKEIAAEGDWIIKKESGCLSVLSQEAFFATYEASNDL